jgi:hypothetical protein
LWMQIGDMNQNLKMKTSLNFNHQWTMYCFFIWWKLDYFWPI